MPLDDLSAYLVEIAPGADSAEPGSLASRARSSADGVRFLRSIYVPEDDRWFLLYEGASAAEVAAAAERADAVVVSIARAQDVTDEAPRRVDASAASAPEVRVRPRPLLKVDKRVGPPRVDENVEEDR